MQLIVLVYLQLNLSRINVVSESDAWSITFLRPKKRCLWSTSAITSNLSESGRPQRTVVALKGALSSQPIKYASQAICHTESLSQNCTHQSQAPANCLCAYS